MNARNIFIAWLIVCILITMGCAAINAEIGGATSQNRATPSRQDPVNNLIQRYERQLYGGYAEACFTLNSYFELVRTSCAISEEACWMACSRRDVIRELMDRWNAIHSRHRHMQPGGYRITLIWERDVIDALCR